MKFVTTIRKEMKWIWKNTFYVILKLPTWKSSKFFKNHDLKTSLFKTELIVSDSFENFYLQTEEWPECTEIWFNFQKTANFIGD